MIPFANSLYFLVILKVEQLIRWIVAEMIKKFKRKERTVFIKCSKIRLNDIVAVVVVVFCFVFQ